MTATLYIATERGVSVIRGEGGRWEGATCLGQSNVECVLADPRDRNVAYCGTLGEGLFKTTDGGASWAACTSLPESKITALAVDTAGQIYAAGSKRHHVAGDVTAESRTCLGCRGRPGGHIPITARRSVRRLMVRPRDRAGDQLLFPELTG
jgi:hypothetical protein